MMPNLGHGTIIPRFVLAPSSPSRFVLEPYTVGICAFSKRMRIQNQKSALSSFFTNLMPFRCCNHGKSSNFAQSILNKNKKNGTR